MRLFVFFLAAVIASLFVVGNVSARVTHGDLGEMRDIIMKVSVATYMDNPGGLENVFSDSANPSVKAKMEKAVVKSLREFEQSIEEYWEEKGLVVVSTTYSAKGKWWSIKNQKASFTFQKDNGEWKVLSTNYYKRLNTPSALKVLRSQAIFLILLAAVILGAYYYARRKALTSNMVAPRGENGKI